ncbi:ERV-BabFcenv provirus ancestral Env polyprotein-like [Dasypus novemcinctus]|uniref:ERV-BabFcenv provirus ancestral Env polyprotein-like n=1 Tax=Dasypus novemcinctus TaxID=9361 RepID=UPI00265F5AA0|nr:ERV-BabFcenv provirus ancestral Env polyprotein-like [Dasypus novemcinctus]
MPPFCMATPLLACATFAIILLLTTPVDGTALYAWTFMVRETVSTRLSSTSCLLGTGRCSLQGCQAPLPIKLLTPTLYQQSSQRPYACFPHVQTKQYCTDPYYQGCPYWSCFTNWPWQSSKQSFFFANGSNNYYIHIRDPWDTRWATGVTGKLCAHGGDTWPTESMQISHEYHLYNRSSLPKDAKNAYTTIQVAEKQLDKLIKPCNPLYTPPSWLAILNNTLNLLNQFEIVNTTHCFLCASFQRPLLAAVPICTTNYSNATDKCAPFPLTYISLWGNNADNITCFQTNTTSPSSTCITNVSFSSNIQLPGDQIFWCNQTLTPCFNASTPAPCLPIIIVPKLSLYMEAEVSYLVSPSCSRRAAFLPIVVGSSITSSLAAVSLASGALTHTLIFTSNFQQLLQIALEIYHLFPRVPSKSSHFTSQHSPPKPQSPKSTYS